ncbi:hypothetical protein GEV33_009252 [Tenebrio molitor]|uniref:Glucuronosyltransferase n=1 Tax=Tenebrio molitor TaxID=7067 RepID=A0A8J6HF06_TENMO|nr:hypothetical protein GEV33_009252 [Tenebrio molitor]
MGSIGNAISNLFSLHAGNITGLDKMLNGHAYSRAVRAHILTNLILAGIILDEIDLTGKERAETENKLRDSESHQLAFQPIWKELSLRGHQVTVLTTNPMKDPSLTNLTEIDLSVSYEIMKSHKTDELLSNSQESIAVRFSKYMEALHVTADKQLSHPEVQALIHNKKEQFDLLMVEAIYPTQMSLSWWFQIPFIGLISLDAPSRIHAAVGNPVHPVLYPEYDLPFYRNLTFWERLFSTLFMWFMSWYSEHHLHPREDTTIRKYFGDDVPSVAEIQKNMSMLFINVNPIFHNIRPLVPATVQVGGGIHLQKPKPLPGSIEEAIYYNVPIVGLPFYGDQGNNAKIMESKRLGVKLKPAELKKDEFLAAILDVSTNSTYKENLKQIAELYNDEAMTGLEKAIWWTEKPKHKAGLRYDIWWGNSARTKYSSGVVKPVTAENRGHSNSVSLLNTPILRKIVEGYGGSTVQKSGYDHAFL